MLAMMKAVGRSIDVLVTATVRTQAQPRPNAPHFSRCLVPHSHTAQSVFQALMECAAASSFDVKPLDLSGRLRLFRADDSLCSSSSCAVRAAVAFWPAMYIRAAA